LLGEAIKLTVKALHRVNIQTVTSGYHFSIRPINQKAWIDINRPRFFYLRSIQYIGVMQFGTKPVISPTNLQKLRDEKTCDIFTPGSLLSSGDF
jgi:hypothetical protein